MSVRSRFRRAAELLQAGDSVRAKTLLEALLKEAPGSADVLHLLGIARFQCGEPEAALSALKRAARDRAANATVHSNLAMVALSRGDFPLARRAARRALALNDRHFGAWLNLGLACAGLEAHGDAAEAFIAALRANPSSFRAWAEAISALLRAGKADAARRLAEDAGALARHPDNARFAQAVAREASRAGTPELAERVLDAALRIEPGSVPVILAKARLLMDTNRPAPCVEFLQATEAAAGQSRDHGLLLAVACQHLGEIEPALEKYGELLGSHPDWAEAHSNLLIAMQYDPRSDPESLFAAHREWALRHEPERIPRPARQRGGGLSIAWISPRFWAGPVSTFFRDVAAALPRKGYRHVFYHDGPVDDAHTGAFRRAADEWRETRGLDADGFVEQLRRDKIDIAVDMAGHSPGNRLLALVQRPVPVQVSWLDYFHSTGLKCMDALLADRTLVTDADRAFFTERVVYLEHGRLDYSAPADAPDPVRSGADGLVLASFNRPAKLNDEVLSAWANILRRLPEAELLLKAHEFGDRATAARITGRAREAGIPEDRLRLEGGSAYGDLLRRYLEVDVALDPFPFSGCATTLDALWMGVPVVTLSGSTMVSRQSASILHALSLEEWVAGGLDDYVDRVVEIGKEPERRQYWRGRLRGAVAERLCNPRRFARELTGALERVRETVLAPSAGN